MTSAIRAQREKEDGFTLIELLVVVIIIGILAAIAIPAFLNQRERAWQSELTSAVRNAALEAEAQATQSGGTYNADADGNGTADVVAVVTEFMEVTINGDAAGTGFTAGTSAPVDVLDITVVAGGFVLCAEHVQITDTHSVTYLGGDQGNGLQDYTEGTACSGVAAAS